MRQFLARISLVRSLRLYWRLALFLAGLGDLILRSHRDVRMQEMLLGQFQDFIGGLKGHGAVLSKSTIDSKAAYEGYDDRDIRDFESNQPYLMLLNGRLTPTTSREQHDRYMKLLFEQIDPIVAAMGHATVLEVGSGNRLNVASIPARYGAKVSVSGIDIAENRILVARRRLGAKLEGARLSAQSITARTSFEDGEFDVVYSVFCLEQIAYDIRAALVEMDRICRGKLVMLEPVFENGTTVQRLYLIVADHVRILLKTIVELGMPLVRNEILELQFNPANQASILIVDKSA